MVDLRVIEGGGDGGDQRDPAAQNAEVFGIEAFELLAIDMLRGVARGPESAYRVAERLRDLYRQLETEGVRVTYVAQMGLERLNHRLVPDAVDRPYDAELRWLLLATLRLTAETLATDGFARGRASQRETDFLRALDDYLLDRELKSRRFGGSYLTKLLEQLPALPSARAPRAVSGKKKRSLKKPKAPD